MAEDMDLQLAPGWTQVAPKDTAFELLMADQHPPGERLLAANTSFTQFRDIGHSGGMNCPIAVDRLAGRAYLSVDGVVSYSLAGGDGPPTVETDQLSPYWMLNYIPQRHALMMHVDGEEPRESFIAWLDLHTGELRKVRLPDQAFTPEDVTPAFDKVLYSAGRGAMVIGLNGSVQTLATLDLPGSVRGAAFDADDQRAVLGSGGLLGWNTATGQTSRLCEVGSYPVFDHDGGLWFCIGDGTLARLHGHDSGYDRIVALTGLDISEGRYGSYAVPLSVSPDGRYALARLTGKSDKTEKELQEAEDFARRVGRAVMEFDRFHFHHYCCVLDLQEQEVWCHEGNTHNIAWIASEQGV